MPYILFTFVAVLVNTAAADEAPDLPVMAPLLSRTLEKLRQEKRTARVQYAARGRFCKEAVPEEQKKVSEVKDLMKAFEDDVAGTAKTIEELKQALERPLKDLKNAQGDVRAASSVRGLESAQYLRMKKVAEKVSAVPEEVDKAERHSQQEYDQLMSQLSQKIEEVSAEQVKLATALGKAQQKEEDSRAALKQTFAMWEQAERQLETLLDKCELEATAYRTQQDQLSSRIQVLESSLGITANEAPPRDVDAKNVNPLGPLLAKLRNAIVL